jgi:2-keto-3-deoxy-L-rhamnonate aldolase RhmA
MSFNYGKLKADMQAGASATGFWVQLFSPLASEIMAASGYDAAMIDLEHGPGEMMDVISQMQAIQGNDCTPLVRVPSNDPVMIKRVLDTGAAGVMIPAVDTAEEAQAAVEACLYPPLGRRGFAASIVRASNFGLNMEDYLNRINRDLLIICQIESGKAVDNVEAIAAVEGVDMLFIGPYDLTADLGHTALPDAAATLEARDRVEAAARKHGKLLGSIGTAKRPPEDLYKRGYGLVLADGDAGHLRVTAEKAMAEHNRWRG